MLKYLVLYLRSINFERFMGRMTLKTLLFVCVFANVLPLYSQDRLGIINSNYAGSQSVMVNPSNIVNSRLYLDVNIFAFNLNFQNNYLAIPAKDYSFGSMIRTIGDNVEYSKNNKWPSLKDAGFGFGFYDGDNDVRANFNVMFNGPSAMYSINDQAFGFYSSSRNYLTANHFPRELATFAYQGFNYEPQLGVDYNFSDFSVTAASWIELGFTYARVIHKAYNRHFSAGVTIKRLLSFGAAYGDFKNVDFQVDPDLDAVVNESEFNIGFAYPVSSSSEENIYGRGWGVDIGFTFQLKARGYEINKYKKACEQEYEPYIWKIGISVLDIGTMKFENGEVHEFIGSMEWENINELKFKSPAHISRELSLRYYGDAYASVVDDSFVIGLPTSVSVQADYHYDRNYYIGGFLIFPIKISEYQIRRPANLAIIPRYESKKLEFSLPLSFYDFYELRLGAAVRYGMFTMGTDKVGAFLGLANFDGFDFYFGIKLNFLKGRCANKFLNVCH